MFCDLSVGAFLSFSFLCRWEGVFSFGLRSYLAGDTMWRPIFYSYLLVISVHAASVTTKDVNSPAEVIQDLPDSQDLIDRYNEIADNYLAAFAHAHDFDGAKRRKREALSPNAILLSDEIGVYLVDSVKPVFPMCSPPLMMKFIDIANRTYGVCISNRTNDDPATVHLGYISGSKWKILNSWFVQIPEDVALLHDKDILYVLVADRTNAKGIVLSRYNLTSNIVEDDHTVHGKHPTAVSIWKMKIDDRFHMAVANSGNNSNAEDLRSDIYIYHWMGTYFDIYSQIQAYDVTDIEPFHIHGAPYMAVANFRKGSTDFFVDSEIFKYSLDKKSWISYQTIRTYGAMDWEFFSLGEGTGKDFFLAVANYADYTIESKDITINSVIYKFAKDIFVPFQCLETYRATSIATVSRDNKFLLAIANEDEGVHLYQYDGWRFVMTRVQYTEGTMSAYVRSVSFHFLMGETNTTLALAVSNPDYEYMGENSVYEIEFVHKNELQKWHDESTKWCLDKMDALEGSGAEKAFGGLQNLFFIDQEDAIVIEGDIEFDEVMEATKLTTPVLINTATNMVYDNSVLLKLKELHSRLQHAKERTANIRSSLQRALKLDGDQEVTGKYDFRDVSFLCETQSCHFDNITTNMLNGEDITDLENKVVFLDIDQTLPSPLSVKEIEAVDVQVNGLVDGVDMNYVVTKSRNHVITGHKTFANTIHANSIEVSGLVDGIKFSPETVLLRTGVQNVTGNIRFTDVETQWLNVGMLNSIPLDDFYKNVVLVDRPAVITGRKTFQNIVVNDIEMSVGSTINGVDLVDLWKHAMWTDGDQEIEVPMTFATMHFEKDLQLDGTLNGIKIPGPDIVLLYDNVTIETPVIFQTNVSFNQLNVLNSLNDIGVDDLGNLDILMKSGVQYITGKKTFQSLFLGKDSFVDGKVDGEDLSELMASAIHRDTPIIAEHPWTINNLIVKGPLNVGGKISGYDLKDIYDRALKLNATDIPNLDTFVFKGLVRVDDLITDNINGVDVTKDLVLTNPNRPQVIEGVKTFQDVVLKADSTIHGLVNNIDLSFLRDTLLKVGDQVITSDTIIEGNLEVDHLTVNGLINGVPFDDVVLLNDSSIIKGIKTFRNVTFGNLFVEHLDIGGLVNGIHVLEMVKDTLTYDGEQNVTGTKTIKGVIKVPSGSNFQTDNLNGIDLSALWDDAVLVDVPQDIKGRKVFTSPVSFEDLWVQNTIDGVTEWEMKHNWMLQGVDQTIEGDIIFSDLVTVENITVKGLINNVNITELNATIVKTNEPAIIEGPVIFEDAVISLGDITLSGKIQGIDLSEEAVIRTRENVITGFKSFTNDLIIEGDLTVHGTVNGVAIDDFCKNTILLDEDQDLDSLTVAGTVTFKEGGTVGGKIADVDIIELYKNSVNAMDKETFVSGYKTFENLTIDGALIVKGTFGGVNINELLDNYMSLTRDQHIPASMQFEEIDVAGSMYANNLYTADQKINDVNLKELDAKLLKVYGEQTIDALYTFSDVVFEGDLFVAGKVNGIEIPRGLMRRNKVNYINSPKVFTQPVTVLGDLVMEEDKKVQGIDLSAWASKVVMKNFGRYEIKGQKSFNNINAVDIQVDGLVDGVEISEDNLLLTYGDQVITGKKRILGNVDIQGSLTVGGLVNGTDLADLDRRAVRKDRNNTITGLKTFKQPLTVVNLNAELVDGVDIDELQKLVNTDLNFDPLRSRLEQIDEAISEIQVVLDNQAILFQYYELLQSFEIPGAYTWLYFSTADREFLLLSDFTVKENGCTSIKIFEYDDEELFQFTSQEIVSSTAVAMKRLTVWGFYLLIVANGKQNSHCMVGNPKRSLDTGDGNTPSGIYIFDSENGTFVPYQNIMTSPVADLAVFVDDNMVCLLYLELYDTVLYCAKDMLHDFVLHEKLRTKGGRKATIIRSQNRTMLAITTVDVLDPTSNQQSVDIYFWDSSSQTFGEPVQVLQNMYAEIVLFMERTGGDYATETFLLVAEGPIPRIGNTPRIFVYKYEQSGFQEYQEIKDYGELDSITLPSGSLIFFALDRRSGEIKVYQHKGVSGFVRIDAFSSVGAVTLHAFKRNVTEDINHYLALAGFESRIPNMRYDPENAKILKSKMKGRLPPKQLNLNSRK